MFERLTASARTIVRAGQQEAATAGASAVEAEHLLLAMSTQPGSAAQVLQAAGLDHARLVELLGQERARSLSFAGVDQDSFPVSVTPPTPTGSLRLATSAKAVLERAVKDAAKRASRSLADTDLLIAVLQAEAGTVPRILALAGADRGALITELNSRRA